jgi:hypothetical protein
VTLLKEKDVSDEVYEQAREQFSEEELVNTDAGGGDD